MVIALASFQKSFLTNALITPSLYKPKTNFVNSVPNVSCNYSQDPHKDSCSSRKTVDQLAKFAVVTLAVGVLTVGSVGDASAAKSGGRVGGQAFRSSAPRSAPRINNNSRTNIYVNPPVAPPLVGGYGYGYGVPFYGGWGWSPFSFFAPGPSVAVGIGGGFETFVFFVFLGAMAAVVRRFFGSRDEDEY
ncbi:hypothetical protein OIU77_030460 [Salix suchowensis]|uniref:Transmembrane protein n=1 Tax=Salix suchowensis TaxID=1278906 RepID=A0ABQ9BFJ7_9ROSI|nr:La-related protein [Salix suchowensis]KAJ6381793.1 hypothetical protein OIU77_030460 [Salix suchowensis]